MNSNPAMSGTKRKKAAPDVNKPVAFCDCVTALARNKMVFGMVPTETKNKDYCKFCGYHVWWKNPNEKEAQAFNNQSLFADDVAIYLSDMHVPK